MLHLKFRNQLPQYIIKNEQATVRHIKINKFEKVRGTVSNRCFQNFLNGGFFNYSAAVNLEMEATQQTNL